MSRHAEAVVRAIEAGEVSAVAASWRRSLLVHALNPDAKSGPDHVDGQTLAVLRERNQGLILCASAHLDNLYLSVSDSDHGVFLADKDGVILDKRSGRQHETWERKPTQWIGVDMSEDAEGTNGIGTCLVEKRPAIVRGQEHFRTPNGGMTCVGAPIFGPDGEIAGCLDVSRPSADRAAEIVPLVLAAVVDAARRIELALFAQAHAGSRLVLVSEDGLHPGAVIAVDRDGYVRGATRAARNILGHSAEPGRQPFAVGDLWASQGEMPADLATAERAAIERALAVAGGNITVAAKALGVGRGTIHRKLKAYAMDRARFSAG